MIITPSYTPQFILRLFATKVFLSQEAPLVQSQRRFCSKNAHKASFCRNILFTIAGADYRNINLVNTVYFLRINLNS